MKANSTALRTVFPILALIGLSATASNAAIQLVDSFGISTNDDLTDYTVDGSGLDLTGVSKIVVTTGTEGDGNTQGSAFSRITFGGVDLTQAFTAAGNQGRSSVWYLDLATVSLTGANFVLTNPTTQEGLGFGAYSLSGTALGQSATATSGGSSTATITTPTAGEFVAAVFARNNTDFDNALGSGAQAPLTQLYATGGDGWSSASGSAILGAADSYALTIYDNTNNTGVVVAASFAAAIPEPSTALLAFAGLIPFLRRRRF